RRGWSPANRVPGPPCGIVPPVHPYAADAVLRVSRDRQRICRSPGNRRRLDPSYAHRTTRTYARLGISRAACQRRSGPAVGYVDQVLLSISERSGRGIPKCVMTVANPGVEQVLAKRVCADGDRGQTVHRDVDRDWVIRLVGVPRPTSHLPTTGYIQVALVVRR